MSEEMLNKRYIKFGEMVIDKVSHLSCVKFGDSPKSCTRLSPIKHDDEIRDVYDYRYIISYPMEVVKTHEKWNLETCTFEEIHQDISDVGEYQDLIISMVQSGDFTINEAILTIGLACQRCRNVLYNIYKPINDDGSINGYPLLSNKWKACNDSCQFCESVHIPSHESQTKETHKNFFGKIKEAFTNMVKSENKESSSEEEIIDDSMVFGKPFKLEPGKYYKNNQGALLHICGVVHSDIKGKYLIAESPFGSIHTIFLTDIGMEYTEVSKEEFLALI